MSSACVRVMSSDSQIAFTVPWMAVGGLAAMIWPADRRGPTARRAGPPRSPSRLQRPLGRHPLVQAEERPAQHLAERDAASEPIGSSADVMP